MLPSTFEDKLKKEEEVKKRLVIKMEVAKFLQVRCPRARQWGVSARMAVGWVCVQGVCVLCTAWPGWMGSERVIKTEVADRRPPSCELLQVRCPCARRCWVCMCVGGVMSGPSASVPRHSLVCVSLCPTPTPIAPHPTPPHT
jgi:hypothetical protein